MGLRRGQSDSLADLQPTTDEVREELERVLRSRVFRGSKRCQDFLQFVVQSALDGESERLKERIIAVEVFGRKAGAGFADDSIVRVGAREVRKRLDQYYFTTGVSDPVRIALPPGSYVPGFRQGPEDAAALEPDVVAPEAATTRRKGRLPSTLAFALGVLLTLCAFAAASRLSHRGTVEFDAFWRPVFERSDATLVAIAGDPIGFGDSAAAFRLAKLFAGSARPVRLQMASRVELPVLLEAPAVLLGSFANRWTMETTRSLPYRFALQEGRTPSIVDAAGQKRWTATGGSEDYLLVCRLLRPSAGGPLLLGAGLTGQGTEEAARILSEPDVLEQVLKTLPANWHERSLELVLRTRFTSAPELVGWQAW